MPLFNEEQLEDARRLVEEHGSINAAAKASSAWSRSALQRAYNRVLTGGYASGQGIRDGMVATGVDTFNSGGWVKTDKPDAHGRTYSFYVKAQKPDQLAEEQQLREHLEELFEKMPRAYIPDVDPDNVRFDGYLKGFIPINDLHAGGYATHKETGYGNWDVDIATARLTRWASNLLARMPLCDEVILFYNGDTFHLNGSDPFTPEHKNVLDSDGRMFRTIDKTILATFVVVDLAARLHKRVRLVVKEGNHDRDIYIALLMAAKWRYMSCPTITVEEDPSPYWAHSFGRVLLFGHHGHKVKPEQLVMKMAADHASDWGATEHRVVWTAHKHQREMKRFLGADWEQASCITNPDAYGAYWGNNAMMQAVIYDGEQGEVERHTVRSPALEEGAE